MSVAACPRCHDEVSVPSGVPPEAIAQCPLCGEEFELAEVFRAMPPALVIVKSPQQMAAVPPVGGGESPDFGFDTGDESDEFQLAADDQPAHEPTRSFAFDADSSEAASTSSGGSATATARPRKKKKKSNPVMEVVKVAGGGIGGVLIALVLLWYLPFGKAQDLLGIGPTIAKIPVIGGIVPEQFRGDAGTASDDTSSTEGNGADGTDEEPIFRVDRGNDDGGPKGSIADFAPPNEQPRQPNRGNNTPPANQTPPPAEDFAMEDEQDPFAADPTELPPVDFQDIEASPDDTAEATPNTPRAPGGQPLGPTDRQQVSPAELQASVEAVIESVVAYAESVDLQGAERLKVATDHFKDYGKLAEAITFVDQTDPAISPEAQSAEQILRDLGNDPEKTSIMQFFAADQLQNPANYNDGIVLVGTVVQTRATGRVFSSKVLIQPKKGEPREVTVVSSANPMEVAQGFTQGSKVAVLGVPVANPAENMSGYQGKEPVAVWGGYFVVLNANE